MNASVAACRQGGRRSNEPQERRAAKIAAGTDPSTRRRPIWRHFLRRRSCGPRRPLPPPAFLPGRPRQARRAGAWLCDPTGAPTAANEEGTQLAHAYRSPAPSRGPTTSLLLGAYWSLRPVAREKKRLPFVTWPPYSQGRGRWQEKGLSWRRRHAWHACMRAAPLSRRTFPFASLQVCPFPGLARKLRPHARTSYVAVVVRRACPADGGGHRGSGGAWATCVSLVSASAGWHVPGPAAPGVPGPHERGLTTALWQACCRPARASCAWRALWRRHRAAGVPPC